ncbi:MAG: NAD(P)-dependent glycerol-3-phosphate dehydrogenase [Chloroflexi bacterium]|nr:NAD(P)-dependent glycerol-3-phosphate dehydrogenase [Chloroflexota bacterium]
MNVAIIGTGSWGTMLAILLARNGHAARLWARTEQEANLLNAERENRAFLRGVLFPDALIVRADLPRVLAASDFVFVVTPAQRVRDNARHIAPHLPSRAIVVSCAKGIELTTLHSMSAVLAQELSSARVCVLSGPNLAREIAAGLPASSVVASADSAIARAAQSLLMSPTLRVYTHDDVLGVELAGALKNVIAIGAGIVDGLNLGENAKAAFITRGLAEMTRLGIKLGAQAMTFAGLAGLGDLLCTCYSEHSRNHFVGMEIARGRALAEIQKSMRMIAEGVPTAHAARQLAVREQIEMPIVEQVYQVLHAGKKLRHAIIDLLAREAKPEIY